MTKSIREHQLASGRDVRRQDEPQTLWSEMNIGLYVDGIVGEDAYKPSHNVPRNNTCTSQDRCPPQNDDSEWAGGCGNLQRAQDGRAQSKEYELAYHFLVDTGFR